MTTLQEIKDQIKDRVDLGAIISRHTKPTKTARGFKACCPLPGHKEKTPSFHFDRQKSYFYCYGCNRGGDVFEFMKLVEGLPFMDALKELASSLNIELPRMSRNPEDPTGAVQRSVRDAGYELLDRAAKFFHRVLLDGATPGAQAGMDYLRTRAISDAEITELRLGWAPESGDALARKIAPGDDMERAIATGVVRDYDGRKADFFKGRLMIPISDVRGRAIGFSGRTLTEVTGRNPKYINSSESDWFKKKAIVYGLDRAAKFIRTENYVCIVEGYFDQWAFHRFEIPAVAVMGTALTEEHLALIGRYTKRIVLVMDTDAAGIASTKKSLVPLSDGEWDVRVFSGFEGKDPDEWLGANAHALGEVRQKIQTAPEGLEWLAKTLLKEAAGEKLNRLQIFQKLKDVWRLARHQAQKNILADEIAPILGLDRQNVRDSLEELVRNSPPDPAEARADARNTARPVAPGPAVQNILVPESSYRGAPRNGTAASATSRTGRPSASTVWERAAEEAFVWWLWHWQLLTPVTSEGWIERAVLFRGSLAGPCVVALAQAFEAEPRSAEITFLSDWMNRNDVDETLRRWILKGFVAPESADPGATEGGGRDESKTLISFEELASTLERERVRAEIARIHGQLRELKADPDATSRLLEQLQGLSLSLEKRK